MDFEAIINNKPVPADFEMPCSNFPHQKKNVIEHTKNSNFVN
jgi:hypothetical protein